MPTWAEIALSDMRRVGFSGAYRDSVAYNDDAWLGRSFYSPSSTQHRAVCAQGRYALASEAYSNTNPDFAVELDYDVGSVRSQHNAYRILGWMHTPLGETYGLSHASGYVGNSRILMWDMRIAIKSKATGQWTVHGPQEFSGGMVQTASNRPVSTGPGGDFRYEPAYGHYSCRPVNTTAAPHSGYLCWHGWGQFINIDPYDVADVCGTCRTSLILHDPSGTDDREFSRFMFAFSADYYPASSVASFDYYNSIAQARVKFVTARWPNSQIHVFHTMTEAQFNAANGYPPQFANLADSIGTPTTPTPTNPSPTPTTPTPPIVAPTVGKWTALASPGAWSSIGVANTAPTGSIRRARRAARR